MLDASFAELMILAVVGLVVLGPDRLPAVARTLGMWVRRLRGMAGESQRELEKEVDMQEFRELQKDMIDVAKPFDEAAQKVREIESGLRNPEQSLIERAKIGIAPEAKHDLPDSSLAADVQSTATTTTSSKQPSLDKDIGNE